MSSNVRLVSLKVLDDNGYGSSWHVAKAMDMAVDIGVNIVSISLGYSSDGLLRKPFKAASDEGALDIQDTLQVSSFSNYGDYVDIAAYGAGVYIGNNMSAFGTSYACPLVSGALAILLAMGVKPKYAAGIITYNVDRFASPLRPLKKNAGALNPLKAVKMVIDYPVLRGAH
ncbi:Suppressor of the cold-sensitive snRNP bioproteinsis mutant brr1-1 [Perkinsus olseni]|uniref:subtilisin n=1 Tax=Perkinsus olseni TaxID=32597 RepID=A0A7J6NB24_PEROL|nr:Suppressor of the cold-sensitive snRNP bioproteinsis mutant brr1-1 [Perkinsus olseni]